MLRSQAATPASAVLALVSPVQPLHAPASVASVDSIPRPKTLFPPQAQAQADLLAAVQRLTVAVNRTLYTRSGGAHSSKCQFVTEVRAVARLPLGTITIRRAHASHSAVAYQGVYLSPCPDDRESLLLHLVWYLSEPLPVPTQLCSLWSCSSTLLPAGGLKARATDMVHEVLPALLQHFVQCIPCSGAYVEQEGDRVLGFPGAVGTLLYDGKQKAAADVVGIVSLAAPGSRRSEGYQDMNTGVMAVHHVGCARWIVPLDLKQVACVACKGFSDGVRMRRKTATKAAADVVEYRTPLGPVYVSARAADRTGVPEANLSEVWFTMMM